MGATLGCFRGGPDPDMDVMTARYLHGGVHGAAKRCSSYATLQTSGGGDGGDRSVLGKLQRTLSLSLLRSRSEASSSSYRGGRSYRGSTNSGGGTLAKDITGARSSRDEDALEPGSWSHSQSYSSASGTSGSRMLSDFYNLVLEAERSTFFKDKHGKRVKGAYLDEVRIIENYFGASSYKRQRAGAAAAAAASSALRHAMLEPKLPILERFAHLPTALMSTSSTISSEMDYWSCLDSLATEYDEFDKPAPRRYDSTTSVAAMNGLLLFSPVRTDSNRRDAMTRGLSKSLSPRNAWQGGVSAQFVDEADDDDGSESDDHVGSRSAYGYTWEQPHHETQGDLTRSPPVSLSSSPLTTSSLKAPSSASSRAPSIYFTPDAARNKSAVAPMMAS